MIVLVGECELPGKKRKKFTEYTAQQVGTQLINHNADLAYHFCQSNLILNPIPCASPPNQSIKNFTFRPSNWKCNKHYKSRACE